MQYYFRATRIECFAPTGALNNGNENKELQTATSPFKKAAVSRNETAKRRWNSGDLSQAHSDIYIIGGVRKPLQLRCEGREAHSALLQAATIFWPSIPSRI